MITRKPANQPVLLQVDSTKKTSLTSQNESGEVLTFWVSVTITDEARQKADDLSRLYKDFEAGLQSSISALLEGIRTEKMGNFAGFGEILVAAIGDVPSEIKLIFQYSGSGLLLVDFRRPAQPALFGS